MRRGQEKIRGEWHKASSIQKKGNIEVVREEVLREERGDAERKGSEILAHGEGQRQ